MRCRDARTLFVFLRCPFPWTSPHRTRPPKIVSSAHRETLRGFDLQGLLFTDPVIEPTLPTRVSIGVKGRDSSRRSRCLPIVFRVSAPQITIRMSPRSFRLPVRRCLVWIGCGGTTSHRVCSFTPSLMSRPPCASFFIRKKPQRIATRPSA